MKINTKCTHFSWKNILIVNMNKIDQNIMKQPDCELQKLTKRRNCPDNCPWFEKK